MSTATYSNNALATIENELAVNIRSDANIWTVSYSIIKRIESERMWETAGYHSFSSWVRHMAKDYSLTEMAIWKIKSAGDSYRRYEMSATRKGMYPLPMSQNKLGIETIIKLNRMGQGDRSVTDLLMKYAEKNELTTSMVNAAWIRTRDAIEKTGHKAIRINAYGHYKGIPEGVDPLKILKELNVSSMFPAESSLSDREILAIVHRYLGANVHKSSLENALREYTNVL